LAYSSRSSRLAQLSLSLWALDFFFAWNVNPLHHSSQLTHYDRPLYTLTPLSYFVGARLSCAVCPASRGCTPVIAPRPAQLTRRVSHAYAMQKFPGPCREAGQATNELGSTLHDSRVARPSRRRPIRRLFSMAYVSASTRLGRCKNGHPPSDNSAL